MADSAAHGTTESDGKQRILEAAHPLFLAYGYKGVSMQQIADAAGIHKATLYHHFRDKDSLFAAVVLAELASMRLAMVKAVEQHRDIEEQLTAMVWTFLQRTHGDFGQLMADVHTYLPEALRQQVVQQQAFPWDQMEMLFGQATNPLAQPDLDVKLATVLLAGAMWGQIWARKIGRVTEPITEDLAKRLVSILLTGLNTSPAARLPQVEAATVAE